MELTYLAAALLGLLAGGLVNALADDLPRRRSLQKPHYPDDTPRPVRAWLGLTAFLLGQRTSPGGSKLSLRYPLVEIGTALLMMLTVYAAAQRGNVPTPQLLFWLIYMPIMMLITVIDIEHKLILFVVIVPTCAIGLADAVLTPNALPPALVDSLIGGAAGFALFFLLYNGGFLFTYVMGKLRGRPINEIAFGYGDVMLATASGLILGWRALIFSIVITVFLGAFGALAYLFWRQFAGHRYSAFLAIPYGPYIVIGTVVMLLFGQTVGNLLIGAVF